MIIPGALMAFCKLRLGAQETLRLREATKPLDAAWQGTAPEFRNLP